MSTFALMQDCVRRFQDKLGQGGIAWKPANDDLLAIGHEILALSSGREDVDDTLDHLAPLTVYLLAEELGEFCTATTEVEAFDAICDLLYVVIGTAVIYDWPLEFGFAEVHRSNMSKVQQTGDDLAMRAHEDGGDYTPPSLAAILQKYREGWLKIDVHSRVGAALDQIENAYAKNTLRLPVELPPIGHKLLERAAQALAHPEIRAQAADTLAKLDGLLLRAENV